MSHQIIPYSEKLLELKNQPRVERSFLLLGKQYLKTKFFLVITTSLLIVLFLLSIFRSVSQTTQSIQTQREDLISKIELLLSTSPSSVTAILDDLESEIDLALKPVLETTGMGFFIDKDIQAFRQLVESWIQALQPFSSYTFGVNGFVNITNDERFLTDEMREFFQKLPSLFSKTKSLWDSVWIYRSLGWLFGSESARSALKIGEVFLSLIPGLIENQDWFLRLVGAFGTQKVVIFNQNVGESRPTGGFYGSYIPLDITQGRFNIGQSQSIYYIGGSISRYVLGHPISWYYSRFDDKNKLPSGIQNLNYFPCFADSAKMLEREFSVSDNGFSIDTLIMITPQLLKSLIPNNFIFSVPGIGELNSDNLLDEIERSTAIEVQYSQNPKERISVIFESLIRTLPDILKQQGFGKLAVEILKSTVTRDTQIWFKNQFMQQMLQQWNIAGAQVCTKNYSENKGFTITPMISNISGDKRDLVTSNFVSVDANKIFSGTRIEITYSRGLPSNPILQRGFSNMPFTFVGFQIPHQSYDISISSPQNSGRPFLSPFFEELISSDYKEFTISTPEINQVIYSSTDLDTGFVYSQPDGSKVAGVYIIDDKVSTIKLSFTIPMSRYDIITYYGQPGLHNPELSISKNLYMISNEHQSIVNYAPSIQAGIPLALR